MARSPLGKGLEELLGPTSTSDSKSQPDAGATQVPIEQIRPSPFQPRTQFDEEGIRELAESIRESGVLQPLIVRPAPDGGYQLVAGERRWRAAGMSGQADVPVIVRNVSDEEAAVFALVENIQREDLNVVDQAEAFARLNDEFGLTHEEIARMLGRSRASVTNALRLRTLQPEVLTALREGAIETGHAKSLLALEHGEQARVAKMVQQRGMSVRNTENLIKRMRDGGGEIEEIPPDTLILERELSSKLGAPTTVRMTGKSNQKGTVAIRFTTLEELDGILDHLRR